GDITAEIEGYHQTVKPSVDLSGEETEDLTDQDLTLEINTYSVTLTSETGISGFRYSIDGIPEVYADGYFDIPHGSSFEITALLREGYAFSEWSVLYPESLIYGSKENPLAVSEVTDVISLMASGYLIQYNVTFDSGSYYTVYAENGSPVSRPITVGDNGELTFTVNTPEGYFAYPSVISGTADIAPQADGRYKISDIRSDVRVNITANAISDNGNTDNGTGGNGSDTDSGNSSTSYWVPAVIAAAFIGCIAAVPIAKFGLFGIKLFGK
ncbi:MAG: hypothetical protein LBJ20_02820, partial [Candidatus Methanoplasma sp.]|nr:hypothetical protein [Candidatus Methanoplasma sp.]